VIAVLIIIGVVAAIAAYKLVDTTATASRVAQEGVIKNHIRYAQTMAMKRGGIRGIKCDGANYWLFTTNAPDTPANQIALPSENSTKIALAAKKATMTAFTVFFDASGRPYTAYTDAVTNTPVTTANPISISVNSVPASTAATFGITPETGFIP
jgi:type II secretory pathway pseudopilin PulG